jgi:hypothetical protein
MITHEDAYNDLRRLSDPRIWERESLACAIGNAATWARYAREALLPQRNDVATAKACIAVVLRLLGEPV